MPKTLNFTDLPSFVGHEVAVSDWLTIDQDRINRFADATGDHQWIHIDAERCALASPFKKTIAHGFLTLSLIPYFQEQALEYQGIKMALNYGTNRVRFMTPVKVDSKLRARFKLAALEDIAGGVQMVWETSLELENESKPACVADLVVRLYS